MTTTETELSKHTPIKPHCEPQRPYGYTFGAIDLYLLTEWEEALDVFCELRDTHDISSIRIGKNNPHRDRIIWEVASHIEGFFGPPYEAIMVYSEAHQGEINIYTPKEDKWWNSSCWHSLHSFLIGLRSLLDLLKEEA